MSQGALGSLDVRSMRTLLTLLTECSVSRTAERIGQTQPTVSLALRRLRDLFEDPLLVRAGSRLVPTQRGVDLRAALRRILDDIDAQLVPQPEFDPARAAQTLRLVSANCFGPIVLPRLVEAIRAGAPGITLDFVGMPRSDEIVARMGDGEIDLVLGNWPRPPGQLRLGPLLSADIVCVVRARHPLARTGRVGLDEYLRLAHLSPSGGQTSALSPIDGRLLELGLSRPIAVSVPEYSMVPPILLTSDLVFTTSRSFAALMGAHLPLAVVEAPAEFERMRYYMLWHDRHHRSPAHRWLRETIRGVAASVRESGEPPLAVPRGSMAARALAHRRRRIDSITPPMVQAVSTL